MTISKTLKLSVVFLAACSLATGCLSKSKVVVEAPPPYQPIQEERRAELPKLPPTPNEVQAAVKRVFKESAALHADYNPNFIAGDFNGDRSQDLAVVIKPAPGKVSEMNIEFPAWILRDPRIRVSPGKPPLRVEENEVLLAVIHGYGDNDWRDPEATQTYLLKNASGGGLEVQTAKTFLSAHAGKKLPRVQGDVIREVIRGTPGYLYYAGATYAWYDPGTFQGEPERRLVHAGPGSVTK